MKLRVVFSVLLVALAISAGTASAQIGGGLKGGITWSTVSGDVGGDAGWRTGLVIGPYVTVPLGSWIAFQPEFLFSQMGTDITDGNDSATVHIDEFQIPLLARLGHRSVDRAVYAIVGPVIGIITKAETDEDGEKTDIKDQFNDSDILMTGGVGFVFSRMVIEGRYTAGLKKFDKTDDEDESHKNQQFAVMFGFDF